MSSLILDNATLLLGRGLEVAGWRNDPHKLTETFPYLAQDLDAHETAKVLERLYVPTEVVKLRENELRHEYAPAIVFSEARTPYLFLGRPENDLVVETVSSDPNSLEPVRDKITASKSKCALVRIKPLNHRLTEESKKTVLSSFPLAGQYLPWLFASSLLCNIAGLATPLLIMAIYDWVIPTSSTSLLLALAIAVLIIAFSDFGVRYARIRALSFLGAKGEQDLALKLFRKMLALPVSQIVSSDKNNVIDRFRQLDVFRDVFSEQTASTFLDLPFTLLSLTVLFFIAPSVAIATIGVAVLLLIVGYVTTLKQSRLDERAAERMALAENAFRDAIAHQQSITNLGMSQTWKDRSGSFSDAAEEATYAARQYQAFTNTLSQNILAMATIITIVLATMAALNGTITFGALIAAIVLVSKALAPIHGLQANFSQIISMRQSRPQLEKIFSLKEEAELGVEKPYQNALAGNFTLNGVTHRPEASGAPILSQVNFTCSAGECVVVMSNTTAARLGFLDMLTGIAQPIAGSVEHDHIDLRQIPRDELRHSVTCAMYDTHFFYGTLKQNMRLASPTVTDAEIEEVLHRFSVSDDIHKLLHETNARNAHSFLSRQPRATLQTLNLARAILRQTPSYAFAEPTSGLAGPQREAFRQWLADVRGQRTVILSTADRSLLNLADRIVYINGSRMVLNDHGPGAVKKLNALLENLERQ